MHSAIYPSLKNRNILISGGASGIGEALVRAFSAQGAKVAFIDIDQMRGEQLAEETQQFFYFCDLTQISELKKTITEIQKNIGDIDVLINNAASDQRRTSLEIDENFWDQMMAVNLKHYFFAAQQVLPGMIKKQRGSIINFSSNCFLLAQSGDYPAYMTAKAAITGLTRALAAEFGQYNIRVNTLLPGWVMTEKQITQWLTPEAETELLKTQAIKHKIQPEAIANFALFLASDDSYMCSKQHFVVDGGRA